ncbi:hypothetical protein Ndes2437B_g07621 [Nannochloris sp. 'desiccata']|nr:hypothetical protein KSW81_005536 [Chlorella desiccata (nom. nud.)]
MADKTKEDISITVATESQEDPQQQVETAGNGDDEALKNTPYDEQDEKKGDEDDEEEETCGFCIYMKGGGCKDAFNAWSKCVDSEREAGNDFTEECKDATLRLRECMLAHKDYYAPLLEEEEAEMEAARKTAAETAAVAVEQLGEARSAADDEKEDEKKEG